VARTTRPRVRPLTLFLLRREVKQPSDALDGPVAEELEEVALRQDLGFEAQLFVRRPPVRHPWWEGFVSEGSEQSLSVQMRTGGAVLFVRAKKHLFVFTFGTGRFALDPSSYERDFGLRVTLNAVDPRSLRSVDMQTVEDIRLLTTRQASRMSGLEVFGLDEVRDMLRGVVGVPQDTNLAAILAGSDRLAFRAPVRFNELASKCGEFLDLYTSTAYREHFGFIDFMRRVTEPDRSDLLNEQLIVALDQRALENIHLAPPELVAWDDFDGFRYQPLDRDGKRADVDITEFVVAFAARYERSPNLEDLRRRQRVVVLSASSGDVIRHWSLYDSIVAELDFGDARYVLSGGDWFEVDKTFVAKTAHDIGAIPVSQLAFPPSPHRQEERAYLIDALPTLAASEGMRFALLDRELVVCAGAPSQMEVCDLLSEVGHFIHVKRRTASATLSHLFAQGTGSATAFINDQSFRHGARAKLPADWDAAALFPDEPPDAHNYAVVYAVIAPGQQPLAEILPFLSQISLINAARALRTMGLPLELAHIEELAAPA
jgi:uncharacterized protein (TIGR04141 family)